MGTRVQKIDVVEDRCDRCGALFSREHVDRKSGQTIEVEKSPFGLKPMNGVTVMMGKKRLVHYNRLCSNCSKHVKTLVKRMGKIDRTRGGKRKRK
jgi:ribosomal protein S27AE